MLDAANHVDTSKPWRFRLESFSAKALRIRWAQASALSGTGILKDGFYGFYIHTLW